MNLFEKLVQMSRFLCLFYKDIKNYLKNQLLLVYFNHKNGIEEGYADTYPYRV